MPAVSAIIPTLNEEQLVGATIDAAFAAGIREVIVSDGGSTDGTTSIATAHGARVLTGERMRARQLNRGAEAATGDALVFLHADTLLPPGSADAIHRALQRADFGGFRLAFLERSWRLTWVAFMANLRTRITQAPWGDQVQFVRRSAFSGYPDLPIMEDYAFARRMRRRAVILPLAVRTSGRRFREKRLFRTSAINWLIVVAWHFGISPQRLARWYRG